MKLRVEREDADLRVRIDGVHGHEEALIEAVRECRRSAWACPSGECMNIDHIEERPERGRVVLVLKPRAGAELSATGIEQCLRYVLPAIRK